MKNRCQFIISVLVVCLFLLIPHDSLFAKESLSLEVQPITEDKVWNSSIPRDKNPNGKTDTYYYPWMGDNSTKITGFRFINLTEKKSSLIEKYGITIDCDPEEDVLSAIIKDMNFLGEHSVEIAWNKKPTLKIEKDVQADADGYVFVMKLKDAVCNVLDNKEERIKESDWESYYNKAKESCKLILQWQEEKGGFGTKENPGSGQISYDIWCVLSGVRCGFVPFDDPTWYDRWFYNIKNNIESSGEEIYSKMSSTDLAKLILAIEAVGYDPRDIEGINLLDIEGRRNSPNLYRQEYAIHSIKAGNYSVDSFNNKEMDTWAHERAKGLKNASDGTFQNADNSIGWQPLIYWYGKEGFEDVTEAVDSAEPRLASIAQRATGAICTIGYEEGCPMYGNNAWNDAQALLFAGEFGVNVLRPENGYTKNGNNILDAVFALINYEERTIPGFDNYDPSQVTRGLNSFVREYERDVLGQNTPPFWIFSDVEVPTRPVNDAIIALNSKSTDQEIVEAREAYESLDDTHKAIFNQGYYQKLLYFESGGRDIEAAKEAIKEISEFAMISITDLERIHLARELYDALSDLQKSQVGTDFIEKLTLAEKKLVALQVAEQLRALNRTSTEEDITRARELYENLSEDQRGWISDAYEKLVYYESGGKLVDPVIERINGIPDSYLVKLSDKDKIIAARNAYETLSEQMKALLPTVYLNRLIVAEQRIAVLEAEAKKQTNPVVIVQKGEVITSGKNRYKVTKVSGKKGEVTFTGCTDKKITKVSIPNTIKYQNYTFSVTALEVKALNGYKKLTTVTIGTKVKKIGASAFLYCRKLKKITFKCSGLKKIGKNAFKGIYKKAVIKVPKKKLKTYKKLLKGKGQKKTVKIK